MSSSRPGPDVAGEESALLHEVRRFVDDVGPEAARSVLSRLHSGPEHGGHRSGRFVNRWEHDRLGNRYRAAG